MQEKQLEILFKEFLINKGYPQGSLLSDFALRSKDNNIYRPDLLIIDRISNEFIALIEFKNRIDRRIEEITIGQFYKYFGLIGTKSIPAYLIIPIEDNHFQIFELTKENVFQPINQDDFPDYEILSTKILAEEKRRKKTIELKTLKELENKKARARKSSFLTILSLLIGITASVLAVFIQQKGFDKPKQEQIVCCDSLDIKYQSIEKEILAIESKMQLIKQTKSKSDTVFVSLNLNKLDNRVKVIENGISDNPEKTLSILQIKQEIALLKEANKYEREINQSKIDELKNGMEIQNTWMLGVLIAIFGTILSFAIPNLLAKKNSEI